MAARLNLLEPGFRDDFGVSLNFPRLSTFKELSVLSTTNLLF